MYWTIFLFLCETAKPGAVFSTIASAERRHQIPRDARLVQMIERQAAPQIVLRSGSFFPVGPMRHPTSGPLGVRLLVPTFDASSIGLWSDYWLQELAGWRRSDPKLICAQLRIAARQRALVPALIVSSS